MATIFVAYVVDMKSGRQQAGNAVFECMEWPASRPQVRELEKRIKTTMTEKFGEHCVNVVITNLVRLSWPPPMISVPRRLLVRDTAPNIYLPPKSRRYICFALDREIARLQEVGNCTLDDEVAGDMANEAMIYQSILDHIRSLD